MGFVSSRRCCCLSLPLRLQRGKGARGDLEARLEELIDSSPKLQDPFAEVGIPTFNLSYQDENNRSLMVKLKDMYLGACPSLAYEATHCGQADRRDGERVQ